MAAGGAHTLRAAGVVVDIVPLDAAVSLNERWLTAQRERRPFIRAKIAQSLDGFSAALDGTSQWITGPQAREYAHKQRHLVDAIVVGTGTVLADQPTLTARYDPGGAQPLRVHMGHTTTPPDAPIRGADGRFVHLPTHDPNLAAHQLYERGARDILIEGGPRLIGAFLEAGLVDLLEVYTAPMLLGEEQRVRHCLRWRRWVTPCVFSLTPLRSRCASAWIFSLTTFPATIPMDRPTRLTR